MVTPMHQSPTDRPVVTLVGTDGNAFAILGHCLRAARRAGWPPARREAFLAAAKAGDYDHLLATVQEWFDVH